MTTTDQLAASEELAAVLKRIAAEEEDGNTDSDVYERLTDQRDWLLDEPNMGLLKATA